MKVSEGAKALDALVLLIVPKLLSAADVQRESVARSVQLAATRMERDGKETSAFSFSS
jgi:hypothetical protein